MESFDIKKYRKWIALGLLLIIIAMSFFVFKHKDDLFTNRIEIVYPDGCKELFENAVLVSPLCENGRQMEQDQAIGGGKWPTNQMNFSLENLTWE